ncbi:aldehyde dehydrogenase family protein [Mycolicibacterium sp. 120266]|uniref:aldehyde dehydrogenase family protein n=1 Tax=Mycolicibacterium sp. 120266 TaxID=3090601 RepID=UPI00299F4676|nr:aldehyde dehydrogenase family protein [Mycolicibacterium sp. 120266]MDX1876157.1 aldehyde dehydrogenase family protein [Mycolicibacterium sp. 120266]
MPATAIDFAIENFIDGRWSPGTGSEEIDVFNPADGAVVATFTSSSPADVDAAVTAARTEELPDIVTRVKAIGIDLGLDD